ncbi:MAG: Dabb family protein [Candidatus Azobacteroides sp.]|nr:Dabb family protein [Candidatus Azobacteroides sp.]
MVKHIVVWKLKEESKEENALKIKEALEALNGQIPGLLRLEVGFDFSKQESSSDIVLYSEFASIEHLNSYVIHPKHVAVGALVRGATCERRMIDYTI